jgi:hypothetical protein
MHPNGLLMGIACRCQSKHTLCLQSNRGHNQLRFRDGRHPSALAGNGGGLPSTTGKKSSTLQQQFADGVMGHALGLAKVNCCQTLHPGAGSEAQIQQNVPPHGTAH